MYRGHFGLREAPFGITPDTSYFFACADYQEALNTLLIAVRNGEGFIKITGEVGTGKTLLCRQFLSSINQETAVATPAPPPDEVQAASVPANNSARFVTAYIPNPYLTPHSLLLALADELGVELDQNAGQHQLLKSLTTALLDFAREGKQVVLCLDEAQAMPLESLEAIRLLTNLETQKYKLLQIVLFGQPELDHKLQHHSIRQLQQRITFQYHLGPLRREDMDHYLAHRLHIAGYSGGPLFSPRAVSLLFKASGGIPRLVNILAHKALMVTYGEGGRWVEGRHVQAARRDTVAAQGSSWRRWAIVAMLLLAGSAWGWVVLR